RPLPLLPRRIGVVTSLDGAAIRDILTVLKRRYPNAQIVIRPARVQGEGAANDIARGLAAITRLDEVDVVIVGRGGGSMEDLWAFNEEQLARAIAASPVAVISAVGGRRDGGHQEGRVHRPDRPALRAADRCAQEPPARRARAGSRAREPAR